MRQVYSFLTVERLVYYYWCIGYQFPNFSLQVLETTRVEESQCHIHRMYFMGSNSFNEPWHLPHSPPDQIVDYV